MPLSEGVAPLENRGVSNGGDCGQMDVVSVFEDGSLFQHRLKPAV